MGSVPTMLPPPPPAMRPTSRFRLTADHLVDEKDPAVAAHNILSVPAGAEVHLRNGDLQNGLGAPYADYVEVEYAGRVGKVSRFLLAPL